MTAAAPKKQKTETKPHAEPVLVVGSVGLDTVKTQAAEHTDLLGGAASYAAVAASLYAPVRMVGVVGDDFPEAHRELFARKGIDLEGLEVAEGKTFRWGGEYEPNMNVRHTRFTELNVFEHFQPKLPAAYTQSPYVLLGNIQPTLQRDVLRQMKRPKFVVADTMNLWIDIARPELLALLGEIDMLVLNDSEAQQLTSQSNLVTAARAIQQLGPRYVAIKKGEHGCLLFGPGEFFALPAFPLESIEDPTGAGDCFAGGLVGHLAATGDLSFENLKRAIVQGTLVASFSIESFSLHALEDLTPEGLRAREVRLREYLQF